MINIASTTKKLKICMITMDFPPVARGAGYYAHNLAKNLIKRGHKVTVITRGTWKSTNKEIIDDISVYRTRYLPLYPFHLHIHSFFIKRLLKRLKENFDIIHFHSPVVPYIKTSTPVMVTQHGSIKSGTLHRRSVDVFSQFSKLFAPILINHERKLLIDSDKVTAVSMSCANELKKYYGISNISITFNGIDSAFYFPDENGKSSYILYSGSLDALKGVDILIESFAIVNKEFPDLKLILAGKGPLMSHIKKLIRKKGLDENIEILGYVNQDTLLKLYQNATILVLPSFHEGMPSSILEAMACGIPVVATDVPGINDIVTDSKTGLLVPSCDEYALAQSIIFLLKNSNMCRLLSKEALEYVKSYFDWKNITKKFEKLYYDLLN